MAFTLVNPSLVGGRRSQCLGPSPTLGSLGPPYQWRHKSRVSLRGPPCAHGVANTPHEEVWDMIGSYIMAPLQEHIPNGACGGGGEVVTPPFMLKK